MVVKADVCIEAVASQNCRDDEAELSAEEVASEVTLGKEQLLTARIEVQNEKTALPMQRSKTHVILVVDKSGSMAGYPMDQVKKSLHAIISSCIDLSHITMNLILYNNEAKLLPFTKSNYKQVVDGLVASGSTDFVKAFVQIRKTISEAGPTYSSTVVVFLTDGCDTCNSYRSLVDLIPDTKTWFVSNKKNVTVHTVGFYKDHDFNFLKKLSAEGGTSPGMFRYCEPTDDKDAIKSKLSELFDFIVQSNDIKVNISIKGGKAVFCCSNERVKSAVILGKVIKDQEDTSQHKMKVITAEVWMYFEDPNELPELSISIETEMKENEATKKVTTTCEKVIVTRKTIDSPSAKSKWMLRILERNVDDLMTQTATAVAQKADITQLQARVEKCQKKISHIRVFGNGISREDRQELFELIKDIQTSLDEIQKMLAEYMRSGTDNISLLARAHDMRFQAVFNKSRRQRVMDKRASKNMQHAANAQKELSKLVVDKNEINLLTQAATDFYFCVMSQNSVKDILLGDDAEDAIGFGLAVKRSEVVLDEPTLIRIQVISGTLVSRNAMLDALEYKINVSSQLQAHGGFEFDHNTLGVTTVGTGREPINAWLPLYVTKSHWDRVNVIMKPALGSLCTLDPLGYHFKQVDVLYMVLGSMIGQLADDNVGEHQLKLLFSVMRTCTACLDDFDRLQEVIGVVKDFVTSLAGRTKDIIPNLHTLIGYIVSLPPQTRREIFTSKEIIQRFWIAVISEWIRRAAGTVYKDSSPVDLNSAVQYLINGDSELINENSDKKDDNDGSKFVVTIENKAEGSINDTKVNKPACSYTSELVRMCLDSAASDDVEIRPFDPASDVKPPDIELIHSLTIDKAMEIWAEKHTGHKKNIGKTKKYKAAVRHVNAWKNMTAEVDNISKLLTVTETTCDGLESESDIEADEGVIDEGTETADAEEEEVTPSVKTTNERIDVTDFDMENVTEQMLRVIAQIQRKLTCVAYPSLASLPGLISFVNTWLESGHDVSEADANSGIAPAAWIEEIKQAVTEAYLKLNAEESVALNKEHVIGSTREEVTETVKKEDNADGSDDNDDEFDQDDVYYDSDDDDEYGVNYNYGSSGKKEKRGIRTSLPQIVQFITGQTEVIHILRAMLCQAIRFNSNSKARTAISNKQLLNIAEGDETVHQVLTDCFKYLDEFKRNARENVVQTALWKRANYCVVHATSPWAFVGYLMNTHTSRNMGFSDLIDLFIATAADGKTIPFLQEKVHIMLTGKYEDCVVLDNGNYWLPEKKLATHFKKLLGNEVWGEFEMELRSSVAIHVYRESDIPNRHGHCNSNPYIPNILRQKLGMSLLPEPESGRKSRRRKR